MVTPVIQPKAKAEAADEAVVPLVAAAQASNPYDVSPFVRASKKIGWQTQPAANFVEAIRLALSVGAHHTAQKLASLGVSRFPKHSELKKMAGILTPPISTSTSPADPSVHNDMDWLKAHWDEYKGQWVALRDGQLLAAADSVEAIEQQVGNVKNTNILITKLW
jgi:hypothetical protein